MKYKVVCTGVENKKGRHERGEDVTEKNFPKKVLKWIICLDMRNCIEAVLTIVVLLVKSERLKMK